MNAKFSKVTEVAGAIALGLVIHTLVSKFLSRENGAKTILSSAKVNAGGNWVSCPNPAYDCEGQCTSQFGSNAWDGSMGSTGSCDTGGAYWNPAPRSKKRFGNKFF